MSKSENRKGFQKEGGYTLIEVIMASFVSVMVGAAVLTLFIWCAHNAALYSKMSWSQHEAMRSGSVMMTYLRNASAISSNDVVRGRWLDLRFTSGTNTWVSRLIYTNAPTSLRDGRMYLKRDNSTETIVARGLTEIMDEHGYTTPVFTVVGSNCVRVAYRVSEPGISGERAADDETYAAYVRFAVRLRNN